MPISASFFNMAPKDLMVAWTMLEQHHLVRMRRCKSCSVAKVLVWLMASFRKTKKRMREAKA